MNASWLLRAACAGLWLVLAACGGSSPEPGPPAVQVSPASANLTLAEPQTFTASVAGVENPAFVWRVSAGTILGIDGATLRYQAPDDPGSALITASSPSAPGMDGVARVETARPASVTVGVNPAAVDLYPLRSAQFTSSVQGSYLTAVDWSSDAGTLEAVDAGTTRWLAPSATGTYRITARSRADPAVYGSVVARVLAPPLVIWLTPSQGTIPVGESIAIYRSFSTNETQGVDISVSWSSSAGSLSSSFDGQVIFSAAAPGLYTVTARSNTYPSVVATAQITVQ